MEYAAVTERVALRVARLEGSGAPERAYTLATEAFREELERVPAAGTVAILREQRTDERGQVRPLKTRPGILSVGDTLGGGGPEGDLTPAIAVGLRGADLHAVIGIGDALEGVLAAAVTKCLGGEMQARMWPTQRLQVEKLKEYGLEDPERKLALDDLIRGEDVVFAATGITPGETLNGVRYFRGGGRTHTVVMTTEPRVVRFVDTIHALEPEAGLQGFQL